MAWFILTCLCPLNTLQPPPPPMHLGYELGLINKEHASLFRVLSRYSNWREMTGSEETHTSFASPPMDNAHELGRGRRESKGLLEGW